MNTERQLFIYLLQPYWLCICMQDAQVFPSVKSSKICVLNQLNNKKMLGDIVLGP